MEYPFTRRVISITIRGKQTNWEWESSRGQVLVRFKKNQDLIYYSWVPLVTTGGPRPTPHNQYSRLQHLMDDDNHLTELMWDTAPPNMICVVHFLCHKRRDVSQNLSSLLYNLQRWRQLNETRGLTMMTFQEQGQTTDLFDPPPNTRFSWRIGCHTFSVPNVSWQHSCKTSSWSWGITVPKTIFGGKTSSSPGVYPISTILSTLAHWQGQSSSRMLQLYGDELVLSSGMLH